MVNIQLEHLSLFVSRLFSFLARMKNVKLNKVCYVEFTISIFLSSVFTAILNNLISMFDVEEKKNVITYKITNVNDDVEK